MHDPACHEGLPRILVVDDQPAMRDVVRDVLELSGCRVAEAASVEDAIAEIVSNGVAVVVTDIYLDGTNPTGIDLVAGIRRIAPTVRVVAVSGGGGSIDGCDPLDVALKAGADACLRKPFSAAALLDAVGGASLGRH